MHNAQQQSRPMKLQMITTPTMPPSTDTTDDTKEEGGERYKVGPRVCLQKMHLSPGQKPLTKSLTTNRTSENSKSVENELKTEMTILSKSYQKFIEIYSHCHPMLKMVAVLSLSAAAC